VILNIKIVSVLFNVFTILKENCGVVETFLNAYVKNTILFI
jgi:hypothetical protein